MFTDFFLYRLGDVGIRVDRIIEVEPETRTHKPTYRMVIDFGKFGKRVSYGRFAKHPIEDIKEIELFEKFEKFAISRNMKFREVVICS